MKFKKFEECDLQREQPIVWKNINTNEVFSGYIYEVWNEENGIDLDIVDELNEFLMPYTINSKDYVITILDEK